MKNSSSLIRCTISALLLLLLVCCNETQLTPSRAGSTISSGKIFDGRPNDLPEAIPENDAWPYRYPDIIDREFIPEYRLWADTKCYAWRITWPAYANSADEDKIPTVFAMNGALNSFEYLNAVDPANTLNTVFSLYFDEKVEASASLWAHLDHTETTEMEIPYFILGDQTLDQIKHWVTERPSLFQSHWPGGGGTNDLDYDEGDFIHFWLSDANQYGGIRIVSMEPRIIEVYLAVPNI